jgi:hypothetical protein
MRGCQNTIYHKTKLVQIWGILIQRTKIVTNLLFKKIANIFAQKVKNYDQEKEAREK